MKLLGILVLSAWTLAAAQLPDISSIKPDLFVPALAEGHPAAGRRVKQTLPDRRDTEAYHILYLPTDWQPGKRYPVLVELAGNGPYRNRFGDISTGHVEGSKLGYGISAGKGYIWLCVPYLNNAGDRNVTRWWGDPPTYDPEPTIDYCIDTVAHVAAHYGADTNRLVLCGFSRGAIACNFIGLHNDRIAGMWRAFVPYSHYDGVRTGWPYPGKDRASAIRRLRRLAGRPQFICGEGTNADATRKYLETTGVKGEFTIAGTGFRNHNDAWTLRPSPARRQLRDWLGRVLKDQPATRR